MQCLAGVGQSTGKTKVVKFPSSTLFRSILSAMEDQVSLDAAVPDAKGNAKTANTNSVRKRGGGGGGGGSGSRALVAGMSTKEKKKARAAAIRDYIGDFRQLCLLALSTAVLQHFNKKKFPKTLAEANKPPLTSSQKLAKFISHAIKGTVLTVTVYFLTRELLNLGR